MFMEVYRDFIYHKECSIAICDTGKNQTDSGSKLIVSDVRIINVPRVGQMINTVK